MNEKTITLTITEKCNLSCVYCYEHNKSARQMTFHEAKNILEKELSDLENTYYQIEFFGGEPFLNFELIKQIVEYVQLSCNGTYHFFATTNGTLVHKEIQDWLTKNKNIFTACLSLDGTPTAHNINRNNSFNDIDLDFFLSTYSQQSVKMTISEQSLPYLAESVKFLTEKGFLITCNLAYMIDWFAPNNISVLKEQLDQLIEYYLENPNIPKCSMMNLGIESLSYPQEDQEKIRKYCGCGTDMRCYDSDQNCYPCQLFSKLSAGDRYVLLKDFNIDDELFVSRFPEKCKNCYYLRICQFCLGSNYLSTSNIYQPDNDRCKLYQMIFKANAKLKALEWEKGISKVEDEQALLRSLLTINSLPDAF